MNSIFHLYGIYSKNGRIFSSFLKYKNKYFIFLIFLVVDAIFIGIVYLP